METKKLLEEFVKSRENEIATVAAFGYGSGVFKQRGNDTEKSMIDTIFVVKDAKSWHKENKKRNPRDYSLSAKILLGNINFERIAGLTGVTYQTNIPFQNHKFKYGVIGEQTFLTQMESWNRFFLPGRFQKPVYPIRTTDAITKAINKNRKLALLISLITLPEEDKTIRGLFLNLCSLSYCGDIRMLFVENPNKVANIVDAEFPLLEEIYVQQNKFFTIKESGELDIDYLEVLDELYRILPPELYKYLSNLATLQQSLLHHIEEKNRIESITQPLIGIATTGPIASFQYVRRKMAKKQNR